MDFKRVLFYVYILLIVIILQFSTIFWIGSKEDFEVLKVNRLVFFINRYFLNLIVIFIFILFLTFVKILFNRGKLNIDQKKYLLKIFFILNLISTLLIIINHFC